MRFEAGLITISIVLIWISSGQATLVCDNKTEPDLYLTTGQFVVKFGYRFELHYVTTEDGYILEMHRIQSKNFTTFNNVVLMAHGFLLDSSMWVIQPLPQKNLAFFLADLGYDVWLGNFRGNKYSQNHTTLNPNQTDGAFWAFGLDELAKYDLPAMIEYVVSTSGQESIDYIGYSMGTGMFVAAFDYSPEVLKKVNGAVFLAAVWTLKHATTPAQLLKPLFNSGFNLQTIVDRKFDLNPQIRDIVAKTLCSGTFFCPDICAYTFFVIGGIDFGMLNVSRLCVYREHMPSSTSVRLVTHYGQSLGKANFSHFDFGTAKNLKEYGTPKPPIYDASKCNTRIAFISAANDPLSSPQDRKNLKPRLKNFENEFIIDYQAATHFFFWQANDQKEYYFRQVKEALETFRK